MGDAVDIVVKICIIFLMVGVGCVLIVAAWFGIFEWWHGRHDWKHKR